MSWRKSSMKNEKFLSRTFTLLGLFLILFSFGYIALDIHWVCFVMYIGIILLLFGSFIYKVYEEDNNKELDN